MLEPIPIQEEKVKPTGTAAIKGHSSNLLGDWEEPTTTSNKPVQNSTSSTTGIDIMSELIGITSTSNKQGLSLKPQFSF